MKLKALMFLLPLTAKFSVSATIFGDSSLTAYDAAMLGRLVEAQFLRAETSAATLARARAALPNLSARTAPKAAIDLPPRRLLRYLGLDAAGEERLDRADTGLLISIDSKPALAPMAPWLVLAAAAAARDAGLAYDDAAMRFFPARILNDPLRGVAHGAIIDHIVVISSQNDAGHYLLTTQGCRKFGLPEFALADIADLEAAVWLVHAVVQALTKRVHETIPIPLRIGPIMPLHGPLKVSREQAARAYLVAPPNEPGDVAVALEYPAPNSSEFRIVAPGSTATQAMIAEARAAFSFVTMPIVSTPNTAALEAATQQARRELAIPRSAISDGANVIYVKSRFASGRHAEFMWTRVRTWNSEGVRGRLDSTPRFVAGVHHGDDVEIAEHEIVDWIVDRPDGTRLGNSTTIAISGPHE